MKNILKSIKNFIIETDKLLLFLCAFASAYGCLSVMTATLQNAPDGSKFSRDFIVMVAAVLLGLIIAIIISMIDYEFIIKLWPFIALFCVGIMLITLQFGIGPAERPDARTWLKLGATGVYFQPSEIVKIGFIITFGVHLEKVKNNINNFFNVVLLFLHAIVPIGLVIVSGDLGSALVFMIITIVMLYIAGLHWGYFLAGGLLVAASLPLVWMFLLGNIQKQRFLALAYPELYPDIIYQQERGMAAIKGG